MPQYKDLSCDEFLIMKESEEFFIVKAPIMNPEIIPGTNLEIEDHDLGFYIDKLPSDKNKNILVYCNRGYVSRYVSQAFIQLGYKNVYNLIRGLVGWKEMENSTEL